MKQKIGTGPAIAIVVVVVAVIGGLFAKSLMGKPGGATKNPYEGGPSNMKGGPGQRPPTGDYTQRRSGPPGGGPPGMNMGRGNYGGPGGPGGGGSGGQ